MLYIAIGILGATVMPHNLYLHSSLVQTRRFGADATAKREAIRFATIDSTLALSLALLRQRRHPDRSPPRPSTRTARPRSPRSQDAYELLAPLLGVGSPRPLFALALLASGQSSTITGTLAGQIVMEGFLAPAAAGPGCGG